MSHKLQRISSKIRVAVGIACPGEMKYYSKQCEKEWVKHQVTILDRVKAEVTSCHASLGRVGPTDLAAATFLSGDFHVPSSFSLIPRYLARTTSLFICLLRSGVPSQHKDYGLS